MKHLSSLFHNSLLLISLTAFCSSVPVFANVWKASIIPASLNSDNTINLVGGEVQNLMLALQADKEVTSRSDTHNIVLEWDLPPGMNIISNGGVFTFSDPTTQQENGRTLVSFTAKVTNSRILGAPGSRLGTEGSNHSLFVNVPQSIATGQDYLRLKLTDGDYNQTFNWPIKISNFSPPTQRPKRTNLGVWDYNYRRATSAAAANGVAKLFHDAGITYTESAANETYRKSLQAQGIVTGGYVGEDSFFDKKYADFNAEGKPITGQFADAQAIISLPEGTPIPGVKEMVAAAKTGDGIASIDYEPSGIRIGFSPAATAEFKKEYNVNDADFEKFREYVVKNKLEMAHVTDPFIAKIWRQWVEFRTAQSSAYIGRIAKEFKKQMPNGRIAITPSNKYGADTPGTLALGCDNAAMSQYVDIIMPQIYCGYGGDGVKLAIQKTVGWLQEIRAQKAKTQLWPMLLVRYAGATVGNSPGRLRQQIIGCLANGADGITLYYPGMMDGPYWEMLAGTSGDIAKYEDFYQDGKRVDEQFALSGMPEGSIQVNYWPNYQETVKNPGWDFTAHRLGKKVLLTLINLQEANDLVFDVNIGNAKVLSVQDAEKYGDQWAVAPGKIGFIVLEQG